MNYIDSISYLTPSPLFVEHTAVGAGVIQAQERVPLLAPRCATWRTALAQRL
jgi:hypothetical protein